MESTGAHRTEAMPSDGLRQRRRPHRPEAKTIRVESLLGHRTFSLELDLTETIAKVKSMIYEQEGTHPTQQVLIFREQQLNDDHRTLADYGVQHGPSSSLLLDTRLHGGDPPEKEGTGSHCMEAMASEELRRPSQGAKSIIVNTLSGRTIKLEEVDLSESIEGVKDMILEKEGIPLTQQRLIIKGVVARKDYCTLEEYGFQYGTDITLVIRLRGGGHGQINIFVTKLDGETFAVKVWSLTSLISDVRLMIRKQEGIRQTQQHLVFCGQPLDDDRTLAYYNIQENSTLHMAPGRCGSNSGLHEPLSKDENGLVKTGQATGTYAAAVVNEEGSSHGHDQQSSGSQSQPLVLCHHEGRNEQIMEASSEITDERLSMAVNNTAPLADQLINQQQIRWSKYSVKALVFAITTLVTYLGSPSTLFSTGNMVFKISIGAFFIADATLSIMKPQKMSSALVYLSCFLLVLVSYLLLVSFNKYYGYAILPVPLPIVAALLQNKLLPGLTQHQRSNNNEGDHTVDIEVPGQDHGADEEDGQHLDHIFELSADIVNCGGIITVVFGNSMVGPVSAVGFLFFYTVSLGLYLMMVTTVRTVLAAHARYLAILLKVLLVITLIIALIRGVHH